MSVKVGSSNVVFYVGGVFRSCKRWRYPQPISTIPYGLGSATNVSKDPRGPK